MTSPSMFVTTLDHSKKKLVFFIYSQFNKLMTNRAWKN